MTYKVTIWNKGQTDGRVRDYRLPAWSGSFPAYNCHGMARIMTNGNMGRPWFIEFEGEVPKDIIYRWAVFAMHPLSDRKNITVNGKQIE